jgi:hypothetical protein
VTDVYLQGTAALSLGTLSPETANLIRSALTLPYADPETPFVSYFIDHHDGWLHVPRGWALSQSLLHGARWNDQRSDGAPLPAGTRAHVTFGVHPHPPGQPEFIARIVEGCQLNGHGGLALAPTRSGKTLCSLEAACRLGRSTLILVDNVELMKQWANDVRTHLRVGCGIIREDTFDCSQPFTVATVQTLMRRQLPEEVRRAWGTVIVDECNVVPCVSLWGLIPRLYNRYLIGLTATPDRKDGLGDAIRWIIGPVIANLTRRMEADVHWLPLMWTAEKSMKSSPSPVEVDGIVMNDQGRVNRIASEVVTGLRSGRRVLVMATMVEHCAKLAEAVNALGAEVDLFVGSAEMSGLSKPVTIATYKKASKGLSFDPPHTLFIPAGPVSDIRQAVGRALQPQVPHRTMILHPVDMTPVLRKWANNCASYYTKCGFTHRNALPEGRWVA